MELSKAREIALGYFGVDLNLIDSAAGKIFYSKPELQSRSRESESRKSKVFTGSQSRKNDFAGVGSGVKSQKIFAKLPTPSVAQKSD